MDAAALPDGATSSVSTCGVTASARASIAPWRTVMTGAPHVTAASTLYDAAVDRVVGDHALLVAGDADDVDEQSRAGARGEPPGDIAPLDRVRDQHGVGPHEVRRRGQRVDGRHGQRRGDVGGLGDEHERGAERAGGFRGRGARTGLGDDERDGRAHAGRGAEQPGGALGELARGHHVDQHEYRISE